MEIQIVESTTRSVILPQTTVDKVFLARLALLTGLGEHQRLVNRKVLAVQGDAASKIEECWVVQDEDSRHGSVGDEYIRKASALDEMAWELRNRLALFALRGFV